MNIPIPKIHWKNNKHQLIFTFTVHFQTFILLAVSNNQFQNYESEFSRFFWQNSYFMSSLMIWYWFFSPKMIWLDKKFVEIQDLWFLNCFFGSRTCIETPWPNENVKNMNTYTMDRQWCRRDPLLVPGGLSSFCGGILPGKTPQVLIYIFERSFRVDCPHRRWKDHRCLFLSHHWRSIAYIKYAKNLSLKVLIRDLCRLG